MLSPHSALSTKTPTVLELKEVFTENDHFTTRDALAIVGEELVQAQMEHDLITKTTRKDYADISERIFTII